MRALVTGASGFVGRHLVAHLRAAGDDVTVLDHMGADPVDVTDAGAVRRALAAHQPDAVYHLAAVSHVGGSWDAPGRVFRVNAEGTLHILHACADTGVARVLVVGSADEYGTVDQRDLPLDEEAPLRPLTPYGVSKVAADFLALRAFLGEGLPTLRVRAFNHTGPGQSSSFVVPGLAQRITSAERDGRSEIGVGALDTVRDFTDVRDVVRAYRLLVERGTPGEAYNVCSGRGFSVSEIAGLLIALSDRPLHVVVDPALVRPVEVPRLVGDPTKLRAATSWEPLIPFERTLADVLAAARRQPGADAD
jgi:GDP-4-dehydro-6-deoxy-D-mannose reductase